MVRQLGLKRQACPDRTKLCLSFALDQLFQHCTTSHFTRTPPRGLPFSEHLVFQKQLAAVHAGRGLLLSLFLHLCLCSSST